MLIIREESPNDIAAIEAVVAETFLDAPHADHTEQFIVNGLRKAGVLTISLVAESFAESAAEQGGQIIGHVAISPVTISARIGADNTERWYGLGPIAVLPEQQGLGIGSKLMVAALDRLRRSGASGCVLLGDPIYYQRFGFTPVSSLVLPDVPPEYFQALSFGDSFPRGTVTYHEAFNATC
jgi:putative acetyltransferase